MSAYHSSRVWRIGSLVAITLTLFTAFFSGVYGSRHYGGNGPDGVQYSLANTDCVPFLFGRVYSDGVPVSGAVVRLTHLTQTLAVTTGLKGAQFNEPLYMFDTTPCNELGVRWGMSVTLTAAIPGHPPQTRTVQMLPNYLTDQREEVFFYGREPIPYPPPQPRPLIPTTLITEMVSRHLFDTGAYHSCAVTPGGGLGCWGWNFVGATGSGNPGIWANRVISRPVPVAGLAAPVKSVAAGYRHTCVVLETGKVQCWGHNYLYGTTGPSAPNVTHIPHDIPGIENAVDIVAGDFNTCALLRDGSVMCWGNNDSGQLGRGEIGPSWNPTPTLVLAGPGQPLTGVTSIAAEGWHVCAIVDGGVKCWGEMHGFGGIGRTGTPVDILPPGSGVRTISVGYRASCATDADGYVYCWGNGLYPFITTPTRVEGLTDIVDVAMNLADACALDRSGNVYCWGGTGHDYQQIAGQFGVSATAPLTQPVRVEGVSGAVDIAAGEEHICAQLADSRLICWGSNSGGQLGNSATPQYPYPWHSPVTVTTYSGVATDITAGGYHTCAITGAGSVGCWGANGYGQLGAGVFSPAVTQTVAVSGVTGAIQVSAGRQHTCALTSGGLVYCWGRNHVGQLGNGTVAHSSVPVQVTGLDGVQVQAIASGEFQTCALLADGGVRCWGQNWAGNLGNGTSGNYYATPVAVIGLAGRVIDLAVGDDHMCAVIEGGAAQCWGYNAWGQLGNNTTLASSTPVTVTDLISNVTAMTAGRSYTCAVVNGSAMCWGDGSAGQLGDGVDLSGGSRPYTSPVPVSVVELTGTVIDIEAGGATACVQMDPGDAYCWGADWAGQLGQGVANSRSTPVRVPLPAGSVVSQLSIENEHMCARLQDGSLRCWGVNTYGQVGNGVSLISPAPVEVQGLQPAQWTYMLYLAGDNDLSPFLDNISRALEKLPSSPALNVVIFFDGQEANDTYVWSTGDGELHRHRLEETDNSSGNPGTLTNFIEWARENFPAQHYYLSIANHGRATSGIGWDLQNGAASSQPDGLDPVELRAAIAAGTRQGAWKFDVIHFDACLMALYEMAYQIKDFANYMIASQNLTAAFYPYDDYARVVIDDPGIAPAALAKRIAEIYFNHDYMRLNAQPRTISVLNLGQIDSVTGALSSLVDAAVAPGRMEAIGQQVASARNEVQVFDASPDFSSASPAYFTLTKEDEYVDLRHLAQLLRDQSGAPDVAAAAGTLYNVLAPGDSGFVVINAWQSGVDRLVSGQEWLLDNSNGVSIFFPYAPGVFAYDRYMNNQLFTSTQATNWTQFLQRYYDVTGAEAVDAIDPGIPPVLRLLRQVTYCPGAADCIWGFVYYDGAPVKNARVTLEGHGQYSATTAIALDSEMEPIFQLPLDGLAIQDNDKLTVTVTYSDVQTTKTVIYRRKQLTVHNEQQVDFFLKAEDSAPGASSEPVQVTILWAMASPPPAGQPNVSLQAGAESSDGATIVQYEWTSDRVGFILGTTSSVLLPVSELPPGAHNITVKAVNANGVESEPVTLSLEVPAQPTPPDTATPTPSDTPTPPNTATPTPTNTATPTPTNTATPTPPDTATPTPPDTATPTPPDTATPTPPDTATPTPPDTATPTNTATPTASSTPDRPQVITGTVGSWTVVVILATSPVDGMTPLVIREAASPPPTDGQIVIGNQVIEIAGTGDVTASDVDADTPMTLEIYYDPADVNGRENRSISLRYWDRTQGVWTPLKATIEAEKSKVTAPISELTFYALFYQVEESARTLFLPIVTK
jgi:alpha-tubulin suppressor-like RCC1 family protein